MALSLDFAFEGFRVIRQKPKLILFWGLALIIINIGMMVLMQTVFASTMSDIQAVSASAGSNPSAALTAFQQIGQKILPLEGVFVPLGLATGAILNCAVFRAALEYKNDSFGYLRFGADELRQLGITILFFLMFIVVEIAAAIAGLVVGGVFGLILSFVSKPLAGLGFLVGTLVALGGIIWYAVRMSLFGVIALDRKTIDLFASFGLTKGQFWSLFVGYVVMFLMALVVMILFMVVVFAITSALGGGGNSAMLGTVMGARGQGLSAFTNPATIVSLVITNGILSPLLIALMGGAPAAAYKALGGVTRRSAAQVF